MFSEISIEMKEIMNHLEQIDSKDRLNGTDRLKRLRQIPPETGKLLALLASNCPDGEYIEIGTSAGYSSMWISLGIRNGLKLKTFEILPDKVKLAKETFRLAKLTEKIELYEGNFLELYNNINGIAFCFIDCEKDLYQKCYAIVSHKIISGGLIVADNAINHYENIKEMIYEAEHDNRFDTLLIPIGKGEFVCRRK
jgi:caffeoyl-CoA O-methyltransferase